MQTVAHAEDAVGLARVVGILHDRQFDVREVFFNREAATVRIPFLAPNWGEAEQIGKLWIFVRFRAPIRVLTLEIRHAVDIAVIEREFVSLYDLNKIAYLSDRGILSILTDVPLLLDISVRSIDVSILADEVVLGYETRTLLRWAAG